MEIEELYKEFEDCRGVTTDTRQDQTGKIFFALKGPNFNGNAYAAQAIAKGAKLAVVDDQDIEEAQGLYFVDSVLETLQALAAHHRRQLKITVVAICGSNGKTTTKELTGRVLATRYRTYVTQGNLNNHIGVPLSILALTERHEMAVIEMGANHAGETAFLCQIADPDFGLITNIGKDHLEGFGSLEGVAAANGELFSHLAGNKGLAFVNTSQPLVVAQAARLSRRVTYPGQDDFFSCRGEMEGLYLALVLEGGHRQPTRLTGLYNLDNAAAALCVGTYFDVELEEALQAVASYEPQNNRSQILTTAHNELILDAYNANPSSMLAALESFVSVPANGKAKVVILGDMAELGQTSEEEHRALGQWLAHQDLAVIYLCGQAMHAAVQTCNRAHHFATTGDLRAHLEAHPLEHNLILLKASRASRLEQLVEAL